MSLRDMQGEIDDARRTLEHADQLAQQLARLLQGRLRKVHSWTLKGLKRELRDFNMHTGKWRGEE